MAKVFLTCFSPFNLREKPLISSSSIHTNELDSGLLSSLAIDLQELQRSLEENSISIQWCSEAMFIIKKMHSHFLLLSEKSQVPVSLDHVSLMDEYLRESLDLLDFCIFLKSAISSVDRYRLMVDFTVKRLSGDGFSLNKKEIEGLARENDKLFDVNSWKDKFSMMSKTKLKSTNNVNFVCALTSTLTTISLLIFCSMLHPMPTKFDEDIYRESAHYNFLSNAIQKLVFCFDEKSKSVGEKGRGSLLENLLVENAIEELKVQLTEGTELEKEKSLETVRKRSVALKEGLDVFESVVNEVFEDVIKGRKKVVALITAKHYNLDNFQL